ncbi:hypothetical protein GGX14DRAFT_656868 [Mycena pura]|uniref:Uncharacterized protein n=1 Tax=Mycena pura TaxID=153505 RepID=A0AAD7E0L1_9AGAR|nr:hypothetical protein GGX14DRAFT_656868 [Mycena pura]
MGFQSIVTPVTPPHSPSFDTPQVGVSNADSAVFINSAQTSPSASAQVNLLLPPTSAFYPKGTLNLQYLINPFLGQTSVTWTQVFVNPEGLWDLGAQDRWATVVDEKGVQWKKPPIRDVQATLYDGWHTSSRGGWQAQKLIDKQWERIHEIPEYIMHESASRTGKSPAELEAMRVLGSPKWGLSKWCSISPHFAKQPQRLLRYSCRQRRRQLQASSGVSSPTPAAESTPSTLPPSTSVLLKSTTYALIYVLAAPFVAPSLAGGQRLGYLLEVLAVEDMVTCNAPTHTRPSICTYTIVDSRVFQLALELLFPSSILSVKLNWKTFVIVLKTEIYVYDISNMRLSQAGGCGDGHLRGRASLFPILTAPRTSCPPLLALPSAVHSSARDHSRPQQPPSHTMQTTLPVLLHTFLASLVAAIKMMPCRYGNPCAAGHRLCCARRAPDRFASMSSVGSTTGPTIPAPSTCPASVFAISSSTENSAEPPRCPARKKRCIDITCAVRTQTGGKSPHTAPSPTRSCSRICDQGREENVGPCASSPWVPPVSFFDIDVNFSAPAAALSAPPVNTALPTVACVPTVKNQTDVMPKLRRSKADVGIDPNARSTQGRSGRSGPKA